MDKAKSDKKNSGSDNEDETIEKPSYTYWKREGDKTSQPHPQPQQIAQPVEETNTNKVASAWNKAGTWEEKRLNKNQIEDFFNQAIKAKPILIKNSIQLSQFTDISGDAYYVFSRGKIKFVYDIELKVNVIGVNELKGEKTIVTVKEVSNADLDDNFEYELETADKKANQKQAQVVNIFKGNTKEFEKSVRELFDSLKEEYLK